MIVKKYTVLLIDDHPLITNAYKSAFNYISKHDEKILFDIDVAHNCDIAYEKLNSFIRKEKSLDIIFLDISLPPSKDKKLISGEDLGLKIIKLLPDTKIIVSTSFSDNYRIYSIIKNLNPEGFLTKNDIDPKSLIEAINTILEEPPYYSKTALKVLRKEITSDFVLDKVDRRLLYELSLGTMMKDLPKILNLSLPAIEKRKSRIKQIFDVETPHDKELLIKAKEKGFI